MKQITILADDKPDIIADVTSHLAVAGIDIESITGDSYGSQAVITLTVKDYDEALIALQQRSDLKILREDAILVRLEDETGAIARLSRRLADNGVRIRSIRFVERHSGFALVALSLEQADTAHEFLKDIMVAE